MAESFLEAVAKSITITDTKNVTATATLPNELIKEIENAHLKIKPTQDVSLPNQIYWCGADALFMIESIWDLIQEKQGISLSLAQKYGSAWNSLSKSYSTLRVKKMIPEAVIPAKAHPLDSGFDISIVRVVKQDFGPGVTLFGTGLIVKPPDGYYLEIVARSSLCKMGWMVANCVGIIDAQYRGELCVPMAKLSPNAQEISFPLRVAQLIVRQLPLVDVEEVDEIETTARGAGGFGSTGK